MKIMLTTHGIFPSPWEREGKMPFASCSVMVSWDDGKTWSDTFATRQCEAWEWVLFNLLIRSILGERCIITGEQYLRQFVNTGGQPTWR